MDLSDVLRQAVAAGASDVHLKVGQPPVLRTDGVLAPAADFGALGDAELQAVLDQVTVSVPRRRELFDESGDLDLAYSAPGLPRFRVNGFRQRGAISFAFRVIPTEIPGFGDLHLPPGVARLALEQRGLVLVTGATGSGKTTTLAAMLDEINRTRNKQDPVEVLHPAHFCIVNQRFVAGSFIAESATTTIGGDIGNHVNVQGALYSSTTSTSTSTRRCQAPVITRSTKNQQLGAHHRAAVPDRMDLRAPGATQTVIDVQAVRGSYPG